MYKSIETVLLECMTVNYPPTFNPNNEKIIEIEEKGSSITVKSDVLYAGMEAQRLYKFKKQQVSGN